MRVAKLLLWFWAAVSLALLGIIFLQEDRYTHMVLSYETDLGVYRFIIESNQDEINKCRGAARQRFMRLLHMQKCERA